MPSLDFKGKSFIYTHHLGVPYRELLVVPEKSCPAAGRQPDLDDNLILHGDNLEALKALLPRYAGRVDCIYIDPPYNTGTEGWCYNDAVNAPLMREWLKKAANPVERDDLQRHDKWLCMMWPRLQLLKELLAEDGAIFVFIDDNEVHRLRDMMDEIFGEDGFLTTIIWQENYSPKNTAKYFSEDHDFIVAYAKDKEFWAPIPLARTEEQDAAYKNPDDDPRGPWKTSDLSARNAYNAGLYPIKCPGGRAISGPPGGNYWRYSEKRFWELDADNRIWWGKDRNSIPQIKRFRSEVREGRVPQTMWFYKDVGHNDEAKKELLEVMHGGGGDARTRASEESTSVVRERSTFDEPPAHPRQGNGEVFITPKPTRLIQRILEIATDKDSLILDSFPGAGRRRTRCWR